MVVYCSVYIVIFFTITDPIDISLFGMDAFVFKPEHFIWILYGKLYIVNFYVVFHKNKKKIKSK